MFSSGRKESIFFSAGFHSHKTGFLCRLQDFLEHAVQGKLLDFQTLLKQYQPRDQTQVPALPFSSVPQTTYVFFRMSR